MSLIAVVSSSDELEVSIREAFAFHLEGMKAEGIEIPKPASFAGVVEIRPAA